jgi:hypothetical protein
MYNSIYLRNIIMVIFIITLLLIYIKYYIKYARIHVYSYFNLTL